MKFCPSCGSKLESGAKFCANCGSQLAGDRPTKSTKDQKNEQETPVVMPTDARESANEESVTVENTTKESFQVEEPSVSKAKTSMTETEKVNKGKSKSIWKVLVPIFIFVFLLGGGSLYYFFFHSSSAAISEDDFQGYWSSAEEGGIYIDNDYFAMEQNGEVNYAEFIAFQIEDNVAEAELQPLQAHLLDDSLESDKERITLTIDEEDTLIVEQEDGSTTQYESISEEEYVSQGGSNLREETEYVTHSEDEEVLAEEDEPQEDPDSMEENETQESSGSLEDLWGNSFISYRSNGVEFDKYTFLSPEQAQEYNETENGYLELEGTEGLILYQHGGFMGWEFSENATGAPPEIYIYDIDYDESNQTYTLDTMSVQGGSGPDTFYREAEDVLIHDDRTFYLADGNEIADSSVDKHQPFDLDDVSDMFGYYEGPPNFSTIYVDDSIVYAPEYGSYEENQELIFWVSDIEVDRNDVTFSGEGHSLTFRVDYDANREGHYRLIDMNRGLLYSSIDADRGRENLPEFHLE